MKLHVNGNRQYAKNCFLQKNNCVFLSFQPLHTSTCRRACTLGFIDMVIFVGHLVGQALKLGFQWCKGGKFINLTSQQRVSEIKRCRAAYPVVCAYVHSCVYACPIICYGHGASVYARGRKRVLIYICLRICVCVCAFWVHPSDLCAQKFW